MRKAMPHRTGQVQYLILLTAVLGCISNQLLYAQTTQPAPRNDPTRRDRVLEQLKTNLANLKTLRVRFIQQRHLSLFDETLDSRGWVLFKAPASIRFEMTHPYRSILISNGQQAARYEWRHGQWVKLKLKGADVIVNVLSQIAGWMNGRFLHNASDYNVTVTDHPPRLSLKPKNPGMAKLIAAINIQANAKLDRFSSLTIVEPGGDKTVLKFIAEARNEPLPDALFDPAPPQPTAMQLPTLPTTRPTTQPEPTTRQP